MLKGYKYLPYKTRACNIQEEKKRKPGLSDYENQ
jgi:hypothetical protein